MDDYIKEVRDLFEEAKARARTEDARETNPIPRDILQPQTEGELIHEILTSWAKP